MAGRKTVVEATEFNHKNGEAVLFLNLFVQTKDGREIALSSGNYNIPVAIREERNDIQDRIVELALAGKESFTLLAKPYIVEEKEALDDVELI